VIKKVSILSAVAISAMAGEYDFDMEAIEIVPYKYSGYIKAENKYQYTNSDSTKYSNDNNLVANYLELDLKYEYIKDKYKLKYELIATHNSINHVEQNRYSNSTLLINYKPNSNHSIDIGKKSLNWGKGYFANPVAFLDKTKDPNNPEASREGYNLIDYTYNKALSGNLKNYTQDIVIMQKRDTINSEYDGVDDTLIAIKSYILYYDTDIDLIYLYSKNSDDKIGIDISKNLLTNLEIHAEYAKIDSDRYSTLIGLKYLTEKELTITSEYMYKNHTLQATEPLYNRKYIVNKLNQKEPLDILYSSIYYKNMLNLEDKSHNNSIGFVYSFVNNIELDISYNKNIGTKYSEYGSKLVDSSIWTQLKWSY
jgi:hypothetical protein